MKKIRMSFACLLLLIIMLLTACGTKTFKLENISKVDLINGLNGNAAEMTEKDQIHALIQPFADNEFIKGESSANQSGWSYRLKFYQGDKVKTDIVVMSSGRIDFDGYFYDTKEGTIDIAYYDELLNNHGLRLGRYVSDGENPAMVILQSENEFILNGSAGVSYSPIGKYRIVDNKLFLTVTAGEEYVFSTINGNLIFESGAWLENWVVLGTEFRFIAE